jgi:hypothetical protein
LFTIKIVICIFVYWIGISLSGMAAFLILNKTMNEVVCRHGNLVVADLVDEGEKRFFI